MIKGAKSFQQKYEKIMGESSADKLWNDVKNGINGANTVICEAAASIKL